ncbi:exosortase F system-associated membrane protein [Leeuwenhoekiella sp. W20_SRS_FM14]|uniref:exosortase F system-associated membrane protein n=1 Tax=Leeuwenhoekiella sp. W20_SRS_FM14 TaxID=3240270 RepID=UPI003F961A69
MKKIVLVLVVGFLFLILVAMRYFQQHLFYDPLLIFFEKDYLNSESLPQLDIFKMLFSISIRFWINSIISICILKLLFRENELLKILILIYGVIFGLLIIAFYFLIAQYQVSFELPLFYVRRFLIQPMLLLILLPAFYYQKLRSN